LEWVGKIEDIGPVVYAEKASPFTVTITNDCLTAGITTSLI